MQDARKLNRIQEIMSEIIPKFFNPLKGKIPQQMQVMTDATEQSSAIYHRANASDARKLKPD
jgi:septation ring formation regulator EzrA